MVNKQGLWFLTLLSLVLVLTVYYITMPGELLLTNNQNYTDKISREELETKESVEITESDLLASLRVEADDKMMTTLKDLEMVLTDLEATIEEKNNAYEQIKYLNILRGTEEKLEAKVKQAIKKDVFVKMDHDQIKIVVASKDHSYRIANDIMRSIQEEFNHKMYISVKFQV
jgi:stage III sporulation protein AH